MTAADKLISLLQLKAYQAVVVHRAANMFYLTGGFTGEGVVFLTCARRLIITDFRYSEQALRQAPDFEVVLISKHTGYDQWIARLCRAEGIDTLCYEESCLSVRAYAKLREAVDEEMAFRPLLGAIEKLRQVKEPWEIDRIRQACAICDRAFELVLPFIREGMTEKALRIELDHLLLKLGADSIAFPTMIASGENGSLCHAVPGDRPFRKGDMITMDFGCTVGGYCSDMTRTAALGKPDDRLRRVYDTVYEAQKASEDAIAPGKRCCEIDRIARMLIDNGGYEGRFGHGLGHSVGVEVHESPRLHQTSYDILAPGHVVTVEPGIYLPGVGGVRIENTVLVTENGREALTKAPRELIIL